MVLLAAASALSALAQTPTSPRPRGERGASPAAGAPLAGGDPASRPARQVFGSGSTRIAVVLEYTGSYARAAQAVFAGVRAAHQREGQGVVIELVPVSETGDDVEAVLSGLPSRFAIAIGPLTRSTVNVLTDLGRLPLPVLALNQPDADRRTPANLILFGLPIEVEARQMARIAWDDASARTDRRPLTAVVVNDGTPLSRRAAQAFADAFQGHGGAPVASIELEGRSPGEMRADLAAASGDAMFFATSVGTLLGLRGSIPQAMPVYGTSQLHSVMRGAKVAKNELDGVRLTQMPWLILPDAPAVMAYPKSTALAHNDFQRLYALGIDSYRLAAELLRQRRDIDLDGVTGRLRLDLDRDVRVDREGVLAEFRDGAPVPLRAH